MTLEERVNRLERSARRGWTVAAVLGAVLLAIVTMGQAGSGKVGRYQISSFGNNMGSYHVVDTATGKVWANKGTTQFSLGNVDHPRGARAR